MSALIQDHTYCRPLICFKAMRICSCRDSSKPHVPALIHADWWKDLNVFNLLPWFHWAQLIHSIHLSTLCQGVLVKFLNFNPKVLIGSFKIWTKKLNCRKSLAWNRCTDLVINQDGKEVMGLDLWDVKVQWHWQSLGEQSPSKVGTTHAWSCYIPHSTWTGSNYLKHTLWVSPIF